MSDRRGAVRKPPPSPHARSSGCRWCGDPVKPGPTGRARGWHQGRDGEPNCLGQHWIANSSEGQRCNLLSRDGGRCAGCGKSCYSAKPGSTFYPDDGYGPYQLPQPFRGQKAEYPYSIVKWIETDWIADHIRPLWSVDRSLPWDQLIRFWLMDNLQTLCAECSNRKTAAEATQRAKEKRQHRKMGPGRGNTAPEPLRSRDGQRLV